MAMHLKADSLGERCKWLTLAVAGLWIVTVVPAHYWFGISGVQATVVSAVSCLAGGWLTFWFATRFTQPRVQALAVLFGTGIRGLFALVGGLVMQFLLHIGSDNYLIWLALFYLATLALETALVMKPAGQTHAG